MFLIKDAFFIELCTFKTIYQLTKQFGSSERPTY